MAIIPIKDIPQPRNLAPTQRDFIRADIREAIKLGVSKFEFDGEYYKYNTLKNNAKAATFSTVKSKDRVHVYCALDLNLINGIDGYLYIDALKALYKNLPR